MRFAGILLRLFPVILWENVYASPVVRPRAPSHDGCTALENKFSKLTLFPGDADYTIEATGTSSITVRVEKCEFNMRAAIWSQQAVLNPVCIFAPSNAQQVAAAVKILVASNTTFTPRSGGHMPVRGHASTNFGVMIATTRFTQKKVVPTPNKLGSPYLSAGPGFRWQDVYEFLNPTGYLVVAGRVGSVGSSLLLGGGMSYFSSLYGWASNNVVQFEIVTSKGEILLVNKDAYPDLFWALKGGSSNYGIVTRYDMKLYKSAQMYGGTVVWPANATQQYLEAQKHFILPGGGSYDDKAAIMPNFGYVPSTGKSSSGSVLIYNAPVAKPKALENFTAIPLESGGAKVQNFSAITATTSGYAPRTNRWSFYSTAIRAGEDTMNVIYQTTTSLADQLLKQTNCSVGSAIQPVTVNHLKAARAAGGDALDLDPARGPFDSVVLIFVSWASAKDDALVKSYTDKVLESIDKQAKAKNLAYPFRFLNDAGLTQDPISTYGYGASVARMKAVSKKYDPQGFFQANVPGFKLGGEIHGY
ncbi:MAG: hypothetical protein LQ351_002043 [Letrouitia transgressa]|nr:MAG: hypothetical protein LQ351_002043 [Letrouitia transgressa]